MKLKNENGFTIMEVLAAVFIFSCISLAVLKAIGSADRIRSRSSTVINARVLAENEFTRIAHTASRQETINDSNYTETINGREFDIQRKILITGEQIFGSIPENNQTSLCEIELTVTPKNDEQNPLRFRMIQGYSW
ncbi:MAG: prepilin-type N-terminal cleavage/methylation domain-containing protein [Fibrobacter sp.]|nr:prepilin-type N-terminal cleavage/methylation domain-containing protein [Fibrobacter sp.]